MQFNCIDCMRADVIRLMDQILTQIRDGSKAMLAVHAVFEIFYMKNYRTWGKLLEAAVDACAANGSDWIGVLRGNRQYKAVVDSAALGYKSPLQIALYEAAGMI